MTKAAEKKENMLQKILDKLDLLSTGAHVGAVRRRRPFLGSAREKQNTSLGNLWFFLCDQGEDTRKWDGKPTADLEARVRVKKENPQKKSYSGFQWAVLQTG